MGDFGQWNNEPAARSSHAAPPSVADELRKQDKRRAFWNHVIITLAFVGLLAFLTWMVTK